jgi:hypothetical protein
MALTVTATQTGATANGISLHVEVITGASGRFGGTATETSAAGGAAEAAVTTTVAGSYIYGALLYKGANTSFTAATGTTLINNIADAANACRRGICRKTATTPAGLGAFTVGASAPITDRTAAALVEILPYTAGTALGIGDAAGPADANTATTTHVTTAAFTPPAGSLLVAIVSANGAGGTQSVTVTGGGLDWVLQVSAQAGGATPAGFTGVFTAVFPGYYTRTQQPGGRIWRRLFRHRQILVPGRTVIGPPVKRLPGPVRAALPAPSQRGTGYGSAGHFTPQLAPVIPLHTPIQSRQPLPLRGRVAGITVAVAAASMIGTPLIPLHAPVAAAQRKLPPAGRVYGIVKPGPPTPLPEMVPPQRGPASAKLPFPVLKGRSSGNYGIPVTAPTTGPQLYPQRTPVRAQPPLPPPGRTYHTVAHIPPPPPPASGPKLYPLHAPVRAALPAQPVLPGRGSGSHPYLLATGPAFSPLAQPAGVRVTLIRVGSFQALPGAVSGQGPAAIPLHTPVRSRQPLPPAGRITGISHAGTATFPVFYPANQPAKARQPLGGVGRAITLRVPAAGYPGPAVYPLHQPVRAQPANLWRGSRTGSIVPPPPPAPTPGPPVYPLHSPIRARQPLPPPGRAMAIGTVAIIPEPGETGPKVYPLRSPVRAPIPQPIRGGYAVHLPGRYNAGPRLHPFTAPVRARQPLPPRGSAQALTGIPGIAGPLVYPLHGPVRAAQPLPPRGRALFEPVIPPGQGPAVYPLHSPVRAAQPLPPRGQVLTTSQMVPGFSGPVVYPLTAPVRARFPLPPPGRAAAIAVIAIIPEPGEVGPPTYPLHTPVRAPIPQFPYLHGRGAAIGALVPSVLNQIGPPLTPLRSPVRAPIPARTRGGTGHGSAGGPVRNIYGPLLHPQQQPIQGRLAFPVLPGRTFTTSALRAVPPIPVAPVYPQTQPAAARLAAPSQRGSVQFSTVTPYISHAGPPVYPFTQPIRAPIPAPIRGGQIWFTPVPGVERYIALVWVFGRPVPNWVTSTPGIQWLAGRPMISFDVGGP